jgi:4-alpha-glucanotransferase
MRIAALRDIARRHGIETSFIDASGRRRQASKDALAAAIEARSARTREPGAVDPVTVVWGSAKPNLEIAGDWDLALEDGSWRAGRGAILDPLPHGYHVLRAGEHETLIIAAPQKAHAPREKSWGLFAPLYAAHTRRSWGAGDLGDLLSYSSWIDHHGGSLVATLPMLAAFDEEPSPYSPVSRLFWNEMYVDVTRLPELRPEDDVDHGALAHLQQTPLVDSAGVRREKRRVLERCAERFAPDVEFEKFANGEAGEYARFMATGGDARYHLYVQYRLAQQMREVSNAARRLGTGLYLDFPLGVHPRGYDATRYAHVFAKNVSVGAPPDLFFTKGQNWGFAPFDPDAMRDDRYDYFRRAIRHHVQHAGILRIDHVMGLHRLFWIPNGLEAKDGVYVRYNAEELYAIVALESRRHGCTVVGEDLGTVPPEVPRMMKRHGLRQMYVVQYEAKPDAPLPPPPRESVASINTHDMPTFAGWWSGKDIEDRMAMDLLDDVAARRERDAREQMKRLLATAPDAQKALEEVLLFLAASEAEIVLINVEDLWGELEPQNVPGVPERSWRHKFRLGLEAAMADGSIRRVLTNVSGRRTSGTVRDPEKRMKEG